MKAKNLSVTLDVFCEEPDRMNHTTLSVNGDVVWPAYEQWRGYVEYDAHAIKPGDEIILEIPSGRLSGIVDRVINPGDKALDGVVRLRIEWATWEGRAGGLAGGLSGIGGFSVYPGCGVVTGSSAIPEGQQVEYRKYELARELCDIAPDKPAAMRQVLEISGVLEPLEESKPTPRPKVSEGEWNSDDRYLSQRTKDLLAVIKVE